MTAPSLQVSQTDSVVLPPPDPGAARLSLTDLEAGGFTVEPVDPSATATMSEAHFTPTGFDPYADLVEYVDTMMDADAGLRQSAILRDPASLAPERNKCVAGHPTVLFDLDPAGGLFEPHTFGPDQRRISAHLEKLRENGVRIAWISGNSAAMAGDIRMALQRARLDPDGSDELVLLRYREDRKQTRRREIAQNACLIAIAGDSRSDFDELFDYINTPPSATMLETLIGRGWFLVPSPSNSPASRLPSSSRPSSKRQGNIEP